MAENQFPAEGSVVGFGVFMDVHDLLHTSQSKTWKKSSRGEGSSSSSSSYGILGGFGKAFGSSNNRFLNFWLFGGYVYRIESVLSSPSATKIILCKATIGWCNNPHVGLSLHNSNKQLATVSMH
jgi:hypothetical protein